MKNFGTLYIIPTPIGNLKDITYRAVEILSSVDLIAAEDTRTTSKLLNYYNIKTSLTSYHKFNEKKKSSFIIDLLKSGKDVALVSDAGTPGISDPGNVIIKDAIKNFIKVETLPGATAFVPALVNSGFDISNFFFIGFPPKKINQFKEILLKINELNLVVVIYESPNRILKTLKVIYEILGNRNIYVVRELTKLFETDYRGNITDFIENDAIKEKGEFVLVINKNFKKQEYDIEFLMEKIKEEIGYGKSEKDAIKSVSKRFGVSKNILYDNFYQEKDKIYKILQ